MRPCERTPWPGPGLATNCVRLLCARLLQHTVRFRPNRACSLARRARLPPAGCGAQPAPQLRPLTLQAFFDIINAVPYGEELAAAFAALPNIPDPVSHGTANFSGGTFNNGPARNGSASFVTFAARVFSYVPCFFAVRSPRRRWSGTTVAAACGMLSHFRTHCMSRTSYPPAPTTSRMTRM